MYEKKFKFENSPHATDAEGKKLMNTFFLSFSFYSNPIDSKAFTLTVTLILVLIKILLNMVKIGSQKRHRLKFFRKDQREVVHTFRPTHHLMNSLFQMV